MKKTMLLLLACCASAGWMMAQSTPGVCGNSADDQLQYEHRLLANIEKANSGGVSDRGTIQYVPVHFHLVGDAQGGGKLKEIKALDQLCALNTAYAGTDIRFYLAPHPVHGIFNYSINATNVYSNQNSWFTMHSNRHANAINIFIVDEAVSGNNNPGTTLAYYNSQRDWIVSRKDQINGNTSNSTIPHEVGHFFSLMHTFLGYESDPFDSTDPTWPVAPAISPGGTPTEKMDGSNCTVAADRICDTPPDYNFGLGNGGCVYSGGAQDPMGVPVDPMENNMMGYFENCNPYLFTAGQNAVILADRASSSRSYLNNFFSPVATEINTPANLLVSPAHNSTVNYYDEVLVEWLDMPEATYYLLEFDIINSYVSPFAQSFVVKSNSKLVTTLEKNRNYYWRVRPFNEYVTCATSRQQNFKTSQTSAVRTIEGLTAWQVGPNPLRSGATAKIFVQTENGFDASIRVFDATGRQVYEQTGINFPDGEHQVDLPINNLENGIYLVTLQTQHGQVARKLSVLK